MNYFTVKTQVGFNLPLILIALLNILCFFPEAELYPRGHKLFPLPRKLKVIPRRKRESELWDFYPEAQAKLLLFNNLPYEFLQYPELKDWLRQYDPNWTPISKKTFTKITQEKYDNMLNSIAKLLQGSKTDMHGEAFVSIAHDLYTSLNKDGVLGSCVKFIDSEFNVYHIATLFEQHNGSHGASEVAEVLRKKYKDVFNIIVKDDVVYVTSDTTPCAQNVAELLEGLQDDCDMHVLSLILAYAAGLKENTVTRWNEDLNFKNEGGRKKVVQYVTPGGQFTRAAELVKKIKQITQV